MAQKYWQCWGIACLAGGEDQYQRQAAAINEGVGLGRETSSGAPDGVIVRFVPTTQRFFVVR